MSEKTLAKIQSTDTICTQSTQALKSSDDEKIFTSVILTPLLLTAGYLYALQQMSVGLEAEADDKPVHKVWIAGPIFFTVAYLIMVFGGKYLMKDREEFKIKPYMFTYNLYQCILNAWCVAAMVHEVYTNPHFTGMWGNTPQAGRAGFRISWLVWVHYNNKFVELLDTTFMILRKKNEQVSFLHCYHHILLIWAWWFCCRIETGGDCYFGATVNSFIHVIMYGYYTLALLNIPCPWKKWITQAQMVQFCACLAHSTYVVIKGNMPIELPLAQGFVMVNMLYLFGQFYMKSYGGKKQKKAE